MEAIHRFQDIVRRAIHAEQLDAYGWDVVAFGSELIDVARGNPLDQPAFELEFIAMIDSTRPGGTFVEFCMHALRWEAVRSAIEQRQRAAIERNDFRAEPYFRHMLESFSPEWGDADDVYASFPGWHLTIHSSRAHIRAAPKCTPSAIFTLSRRPAAGRLNSGVRQQYESNRGIRERLPKHTCFHRQVRRPHVQNQELGSCHNVGRGRVLYN